MRKCVSPMLFSVFPKLDAHDRAVVDDGRFHEQLALVVLVDDTTGQREAETPTTAFRRVAGREDALLHLDGNAFARVGNVHKHPVLLLQDVDGDGTLAIHGIHGVFAEVFNHPLKQIAIKWNNNGGVFGPVEMDFHHRGNPALEILGKLVDDDY